LHDCDVIVTTSLLPVLPLYLVPLAPAAARNEQVTILDYTVNADQWKTVANAILVCKTCYAKISGSLEAKASFKWGSFLGYRVVASGNSDFRWQISLASQGCTTGESVTPQDASRRNLHGGS
jgi:hypothetical protein